MNETSVDWSLQKFGIGQPVPRTEDPRLVRGEGRYTDDVNLPGQAYAAIVRSRHAHGVIRNIDVFYDAFEVTADDVLFLDPQRRVRIWN